MHIFELTRRLIDIESITENEGEIARFLADYLSGLQYQVTLQEVSQRRWNVVATAGHPYLVFTTHMDTVPPYVPFREDAEFLYGRGACDAKGLIAAQVEAAQTLRREGETRLGLLFVVGEERNSTGAICANKAPIGSRFFIDGEPTENRLALGTKGALRAEIITHGKAAHSAYPEVGESAVLKLLDILEEIRQLTFPAHDLFGDTTCNIGVLEGGRRANVIPDYARAEVMFRSAEPLGTIMAHLENIVTGRGEVRCLFEVPAIRMNGESGFETTVVSFSTDVPFLRDWGEPYLLGPGSILDAHTDHERISKKELKEGVDLYVRLAKELLRR